MVTPVFVTGVLDKQVVLHPSEHFIGAENLSGRDLVQETLCCFMCQVLTESLIFTEKLHENR